MTSAVRRGVEGADYRRETSSIRGACNEIRIHQDGQPEVFTESDGGITISVPIRIKRRGSRKVVIFKTGEDGGPCRWNDRITPVQLALVRGYRWLVMLERGEVRALSEVAECEGVDRAYVSRMINLTMLAPDIISAILDEVLPTKVTLIELASGTPPLWEEQHQRLWKSG